MVCHGEVIVNCLRHSHKSDIASDLFAVGRQLVDGVHGIISADVEEVSDIHIIEFFEYIFIHGLCAFCIQLRQLVTAASQIA